MTYITEEERELFLENGFLVERGFFTMEQTHFLRDCSNEMGKEANEILRIAGGDSEKLIELFKTPPYSRGLIVVPERDNPLQVCRFEYLLGSNHKLEAFVRGLITPAISELMGEEHVIFKDKENEKLPGGGAFRPHQDFPAYEAFGPEYNVTAMISIDPANTKNGAVQFAINYNELANSYPEFVHSSYNGRRLFHYYSGGPKNGDIRDDITKKLEWRIVETNSEDIVIFDSFVPHYSEPNRSSKSRRAMFLTHTALCKGELYNTYYNFKRNNPQNPMFHISTPTKHANM